MITFKQFVTEALELQRSTFRVKGKLKSSAKFTDTKNINGEPVNVTFSKLHKSKAPPRSYSADFDVGGDMENPDPRVSSKAVISHASNSVSNFAGKLAEKGGQLHLQANSKRKVPVYKAFANRLARKHGGSVEEVNHPADHPLAGMPKYVVHLPGKR